MSLNTSEALPQVDFPAASLLYDRSSKERAGSAIRIECAEDIVRARKLGTRVARASGCNDTRLLILNTVISELCRNLLLYAGGGEIELNVENRIEGPQVVVTAKDSGPGIADIKKAMSGGRYPGSSGSPGMGLYGIQQLADEIGISSDSAGTCVTVRIGVFQDNSV